MRILITGASGLVGGALAPFLVARGHEVLKLQRSPQPANATQPWWNPEAERIAFAGAAPLDAAIHLAGENIAQRWTPAAKARLRNSRVNGTKLVSAELARLAPPPKLLVCASATGYYGNRGDELLDERSPPGTGFLADLCREWEAATAPAAERGIRVVNLRLGVVLAAQGGALAKMLPAFRLGLGGKLGSGRQFWSWIALADLLSIILHIISHEPLRGPINAVSPHPLPNTEFTRTLGSVLGRPAFLGVPAFGLKLILGEMAEEALLASCRVRPAVLQESGFAFAHPDLEGALRSLLNKPLWKNQR